MTRIKICGLSRVQDVSYVNEAMPEYAGFVFWEPSSRNVTYEKAKELRELLNPSITTVGVFVDADIEFMAKLCDENIISIIQLHGKETDDTIAEIRRRVKESVIIIKAFEVSSGEDVTDANNSTADMILVDSGKGSGKAFDWSILEMLNRDYFLAGGLSAENVAEAVNRFHPFAVDVSSKVETDKKKDRDKICAFCEAVRQAQM